MRRRHRGCRAGIPQPGGCREHHKHKGHKDGGGESGNELLNRVSDRVIEMKQLCCVDGAYHTTTC